MEFNKNSNDVTTYANSTGVWSKIYDIVAPDKTVYTLNDGSLLLMDLQTSAPAKLPADTRILIAVKNNIQILPDDIKELSYHPYFQLSLSEQLNENNQGPLRVTLKKGYIDIVEKHEISVWAHSSAAVSWSDSQLVLNLDQNSYR